MQPFRQRPARLDGWNPTGRAYPDIAAYGAGFPIVDVDGEISATAGTSLSAPMAAALFSLANQALMRDGYDTIGYANPMLYWMGENCTDAISRLCAFVFSVLRSSVAARQANRRQF